MSETNSRTASKQFGNPLKVDNATLDWSDTDHPRSVLFDDVYYSAAGAMTESEHVFLKGCNLKARWREKGQTTHDYSIAEIGFGSGLNFLMTWQLWQQSENKPQRLHYIAFEKHPLNKKDLARILKNWPSLSSLASTLLDHYRDFGHVCHRLRLSADVLLDIHYGDALTRLQTMSANSQRIDSWYLDGFSPKTNPELWQQQLCFELARLSQPQATLATYSAAGFIRRQLIQAGFLVTKAVGHGKKRHMTIAVFPNQSEKRGLVDSLEHFKTEPWFTLPRVKEIPRSAIVIGSGLAGCSTAFALAQRGIEVTVLDTEHSCPSGASSISQLALRPRLFKTGTVAAEFYLQGFLFSVAQFNQLSKNQEVRQFWNPCGVVQLANALNKRHKLSGTSLEELYGDKVVRKINEIKASQLTGISIGEEGLFFELGGWVNSQRLCQRYLNDSRIQLISNCNIELIRKNETYQRRWHVRSTSQQQFDSDIVILANSQGASMFPMTEALPLSSVRGQVSYVDANGFSTELRTVVCGQRSLFPAENSVHTVAASYRQGEDMTKTEEDNTTNMKTLAADFPQFATLSVTDSQVGIRCNTPDYMPIIGMAPNLNKMEAEYAQLRRDATAELTNAGHYHEGLYLNLAHGSNGLATTPLAGETLASLICNEISPISTKTLALLNGVRFLIRDLKKQK